MVFRTRCPRFYYLCTICAWW